MSFGLSGASTFEVATLRISRFFGNFVKLRTKSDMFKEGRRKFTKTKCTVSDSYLIVNCKPLKLIFQKLILISMRP